MEAIAAPLQALVEQASWFVRAREVRLLHVVASSELRQPALGVVMGQEFHADNRSPFVRLEDAYLAADRGWEMRAARLRAEHERRRTGMAKEGYALPALPPEPREPEPLWRFAAQLKQVAAARCEPLEGLVVVLAPAQVEKPRELEAELGQLLRASALRDVRWIVVDVEPGLQALLEELGDAALHVECRADEDAQKRELARMLDAAAAAGPDAPGPAQVGATWPRGVTPPPRPGKPSLANLDPAVLEQAGIPAAFVLGGGQKLRAAILRGAQALREGRGAEALQHQQKARELCLELKMEREAVVMELVLGGYLTCLNQRPRAVETYQQAAQRAAAAGLPQQEAQALLALGALHLVGRDNVRAAEAYGRAGQVAAKGGIPMLAIEGYRLAGQAARDARLDEQATAFWKKALAVAEEAPEDEAQASSAAEAARALAALCHKKGLHAQAAALEEQSVRLEPPQSAEEVG